MARPSIVAQINAYNTYTPQEVVQAYGNTRQAAKAIGTSQRTVQRWITQEGTQKAKPSKANQAKLNEAGRKASGKRPIGVTFGGQVKINGYVREREINRVYDSDTWNDLSRMALAGDEDGIYEAIADEYGVRSFDMEDGEIEIGED